ncbi:hypothetical protein CAAN1_33S00584 [[Candida] anglica]|uniref:Uncharacterized protein n=1 Tax=[Candida] anglica TaxID=148631 RepID=A0ABP0EA03_9ASCO
MPSILHTRDWGDTTVWGNSGGARWAFFAIFIVLVLVVIIGTLRVNRRRSRQGVQPLYGTRWMTPPSYIQSENQNQRQRNDPEGVSPYVPTYTAEATDRDMGYYDANGEFHPAQKGSGPNKSPTSGGGITFTGMGSSSNGVISSPPPTHNRNSSVNDGIPLGDVPPRRTDSISGGGYTFEGGDPIQPPPGPPPGQAGHPSPTLHDYHHDDSTAVQFNEDEFFRPSGPPPRSTTLDGVSSSTPSGSDSLPSFSEGPNPPVLKTGKGN